MKIRVTLSRTEIATAIHNYLTDKKGLKIDEVESIMSEEGQEVCGVDKPDTTKSAFVVMEDLGEGAQEFFDQMNGVGLNGRLGPMSPGSRNIPSEYKNNVRVTFVVDTSASMSDEPTCLAVHRLISKIKGLHKDVYIQQHYNYISYSSKAQVVERQEDLYEYPHAGTNIVSGLDLASKFGDLDVPNRDFDRYTYLITDGDMDQNEDALDETATLLGILDGRSTLSIIEFNAVPLFSDRATLRDISPDGTVFAVVDAPTKLGVDTAMDQLSITNPCYSNPFDLLHNFKGITK